MQSLTLAQSIWPQARRANQPAQWLVRNISLTLGFSILIAASAHVQVRLGSPVPITGQTFGVLFAAALLGPRLGVATVLAYLLEGFAGAPVFSSAAGISSYGYLFGFLPAAALVGFLAERGWDRKPLRTAAMMLLGSAVIYLFGAGWLSHFVGGTANAVKFGVMPFLIVDAAKAALAAALLPLGWRMIGKSSGRAS